MINEDVLKIVLNDKTFGRDQAADIVGGLSRLRDLIGRGLIRAEKPTNKQNGKWFCNAWDVVKHARLKWSDYGRKEKSIRKNPSCLQ